MKIPGKDPKLFQREGDEQLNRDDFHCFTRLTFPNNCDFMGREFKQSCQLEDIKVLTYTCLQNMMALVLATASS